MRPARNTEQGAAGLDFRALQHVPNILDGINQRHHLTSLHVARGRCGCAVASPELELSTRHHARDLYMYASHLFVFFPSESQAGVAVNGRRQAI